MLRVVLAAALATAVLGASLPAVDGARTDRTATALDSSIARLSAAGSALAVGSDAPSDPAVAPARTVALSLPRPTWTAAAVDYVAVGGSPGGPGNRSVVTYAVESAGETRRLLSVPVPVRTPGGPVVFRGRGERTVSLSLRTTADGPALVVGRGPS
ncbi:DUF7311 family protein [Halogeometricum luteum]|uniref:DUF7311 domain-containing protein n=1 Tax=Halogeometricum luteum TaxID=2950537 RepID=A0ABU2FZW1_9EURY|nr:hypothetical protein [Halogeometricum sp. S3BR5-2]MDS0293563.1 hypothetical protein [Halogeometricum sp. S3BR5-2]